MGQEMHKREVEVELWELLGSAPQGQLVLLGAPVLLCLQPCAGKHLWLLHSCTQVSQVSLCQPFFALFCCL